MKAAFLTVFAAILLLGLSQFPYSDGLISSLRLIPDSAYGKAFAQEMGTSKVVFKVKCYDEGKAALQGLHGIRKVETGVHYLHETDTVYYDPNVITIKEMESALKKAGTYVETIIEKARN